MNRSPYGNSVEDVLFVERDWPAELLKAVRERDYLEDRVHTLEEQLFSAQQKLANRADRSACQIPHCAELAAPYAKLPLCEPHMAMAYRDMEAAWQHQREQMSHLVPPHVRRRLAEEARPWVVYYIKLGDRVKIGRTTDLAQRMRAFVAQPDQLLAVEPGVVVGGVDRELERHRQFAESRLPGTELFEVTPELEKHIAEVVATFGDPSQYL